MKPRISLIDTIWDYKRLTRFIFQIMLPQAVAKQQSKNPPSPMCIKLRNGDNENTCYAWFYSLSPGNRSEFPLKKGSFLRNLKLESQLKTRMLCMTGIQRVHDTNSHCEHPTFWDYRIHTHVHNPFDIANLQLFSFLLSIRIYLSEKAPPFLRGNKTKYFLIPP